MAELELDRAKVQRLRLEAQLSYAQAAAAAGDMHRQRWYEIESGDKSVTLTTVNSVARALGVYDPSRLLKLVQRPHPPLSPARQGKRKGVGK